MKNTIPKMTDPDGRNWLQPPTDNILIDDHHALMTQSDSNQLIDYSHSVPSGVYPGKMWKTTELGGRQFLWWFGEHPDRDDICTNNRREILVVDEQANSGIKLEVLWMGKNDVFVSFVKGPASLSKLQDIETQLLKDADEYEMFKEHGTYQISVTRDHGEFDSFGRCEITPYWDFDIYSFEPMPEE